MTRFIKQRFAFGMLFAIGIGLVASNADAAAPKRQTINWAWQWVYEVQTRPSFGQNLPWQTIAVYNNRPAAERHCNSLRIHAQFLSCRIVRKMARKDPNRVDPSSLIVRPNLAELNKLVPKIPLVPRVPEINPPGRQPDPAPIEELIETRLP